jgi:hypothetical protein
MTAPVHVVSNAPMVRLVPVKIVAAPTRGCYYRLPNGQIGLCYATTPTWRFACALGEPDAELSPYEPNTIEEMELTPCT